MMIHNKNLEMMFIMFVVIFYEVRKSENVFALSLFVMQFLFIKRD